MCKHILNTKLLEKLQISKGFGVYLVFKGI